MKNQIMPQGWKNKNKTDNLVKEENIKDNYVGMRQLFFTAEAAFRI
jgi:hypothetical protein